VHGSASPGASTTASQALLALPDACFQTSAIAFQSRHSGGEPDAQCTVHPEPAHNVTFATVVVVVVAWGMVSEDVCVVVDVAMIVDVVVVCWPLHAEVQADSALQ
jgi:hypothetical protein